MRCSSPLTAGLASNMGNMSTLARTGAPSNTSGRVPISQSTSSWPITTRTFSAAAPEGIATVDCLSRTWTEPLSRSWVDVSPSKLDKVPDTGCKPTSWIPASSASVSTCVTSGTVEMAAQSEFVSPDALVAQVGSKPDRPGKQHQPRWSLAQSFVLSEKREHDHFFKCTPLLDSSVVSSISNAIEQLNEGSLLCPGGQCIVHVASSAAYCFLYREDQRDIVLSAASPQAAHFVPPSVPKVPNLPETLQRPLQYDAARTSEAASVPDSAGRQQLYSQRCQTVARSRTLVYSQKEQPSSPSNSAGSLRTKVTSPRFRRSSSADVTRIASMPTTLHRLEIHPHSNLSLSATIGKRTHSATRTIHRGRSCDNFGCQVEPSASKQPLAKEHAYVSPLANSSTNRSMSITPSSPRVLEPRRIPFAAKEGVDSPSHRLSKNCQASVANSGGTPGKKGEHVIDIGQHTFELFKVIGRGAFGVVWRARQTASDNEDIAIKVVTAKETAAFAAASFEAELLQLLCAGMGVAARGHVPQYISHSTARNDSQTEGGIVRLAMTLIPGRALDQWLYGMSDEEHKTVDVSQLVDGHLPGGRQGSCPWLRACSIVQELLSQLSSVFAALEPIAYHRDVSSHNVLIQSSNEAIGKKPNFALIDFGLAVRSGSWSKEWRSSNLAGDPRYWTPPAWMAFAFGFKYISRHPNSGFLQQYLTRMDYFSLGILGLEVLLAVWDASEAHDGKHPGFLEIRSAWRKYWAAVLHLFQMFHRDGASEVRQFLTQSKNEGVKGLVNDLRELRQCLRSAAIHPLNSQCAALLLVLANLIDERGTMTWQELPSVLGEDNRARASLQEGMSTCTHARTASLFSNTVVSNFNHRRIRSTGLDTRPAVIT